MSTDPEATYFNKSAYVALSCLIAFVVVITICVIKQFIWDPLLSKPFKVLRPVLSESFRRFPSSFYGSQSTRNSSLLIHKSLSDTCVKTNDPPLLSSKNFITITQSLPSTDNQNKNLSHPSYGSSSVNSYAYTNYGSDDLNDEQANSPILYFNCEYNPTTFSIKLNIQNLRHMNLFNSVTKSDAYIFIRFTLSTSVTAQPYQTSLQHYQDFIHFGETFTILNNIHRGDLLNYQIKYSVNLLINENIYELGEAIYSMKNDYLTYASYVERTLPINLKLVNNEINK